MDANEREFLMSYKNFELILWITLKITTTF